MNNMKYEPAYTQDEYYEMIEEATAGGDCEGCSYGVMECCHLQCTRSYGDFIRKDREEWKRIMGLA